jgi:hypothetical protein
MLTGGVALDPVVCSAVVEGKPTLCQLEWFLDADAP